MSKFGKIRNVVAGAAILASTSIAAIEANAKDYFVTADAMIDVVDGKRIERPAILVRHGRISAIGTQGQLEAPQGIEVVNLEGQTLMPGLMDMHVHLSSDAEAPFYAGLGQSIPRQTVVAVKNARRTLMAGFTTVRNVGAGGYSVIGVRDGINAGDIIGPRIYAAGHSVGITGGHCDNNFLPPEMKLSSGGAADGPWAVRAKVRENIKYGANAIKVCATGGVFSKGTKVGVQQMTLEELKAAVEEAHLRGLTIAAHAHGTDGIKAAIVAGVDSIEHASFADDEAINLAKKFGTYFSMDIYNTEYTLAFGEANGVPEENINKEKQVSAAQRDSFNRAVKAGVKMVFGSDAAIYPHGDNGKQLSRMVQFGMTPLQALQAATINAATLLKQENDLGVIREGYIADIIAVTGNPLDDVAVAEHVSFVMKDGEIYKR
ncbi:Xaa-Pro dipeptidase [Kordiimonas aquimaris]|uniref:Xaa-Pro dipeptidase n=1 Tax=Kordiimonas aquimaris TaxID=707591 RepID=UPI0021D176F8|nr:amidohydrolase family protein [Kordiimonas aquimaris]